MINAVKNQPIKLKKGGALPGAGRKNIGATKRVDLRLTPEDKAAYDKAGGLKWFRKILQDIRVST